jgi:hypothetical protein
MNTGSIVDYYDDPFGTVLKRKIAHKNAIPEFIKKASYLSPETRDKLPDDAFAVVMFDQGTAIRKFACVDKGNTALSAMYFLENHEKLPVEVQKVAAANLIEHCKSYKLEVPLALHKIAATRASGVGAHRMTAPKKLEKGADLNGSNIMPYGGSPKTAAALYVDTTGKSAPTKMVKKAYSRYCLVKEGSAKFPIDTYGQVLEASRWFDDNGSTLHPEERREYCVKLAARADELGVRVSDRINKYAGAGFAPDGEVRIAVTNRMQYWQDGSPERGVLEGMMGKYAGVTPGVFCEALRQFDVKTGLSHHWDDGVLDPWYSTYGFEKKAEWVWEQGNDRIVEEQLKKGALENRETVSKMFGRELADSMVENPTQVFDSLPLDHKRIITRICCPQ